eukprot:490155-Amphidinium_carterae.1
MAATVGLVAHEIDVGRTEFTLREKGAFLSWHVKYEVSLSHILQALAQLAPSEGYLTRTEDDSHGAEVVTASQASTAAAWSTLSNSDLLLVAHGLEWQELPVPSKPRAMPRVTIQKKMLSAGERLTATAAVPEASLSRQPAESSGALALTRPLPPPPRASSPARHSASTAARERSSASAAPPAKASLARRPEKTASAALSQTGPVPKQLPLHGQQEWGQIRPPPGLTTAAVAAAAATADTSTPKPPLANIGSGHPFQTTSSCSDSSTAAVADSGDAVTHANTQLQCNTQ